MLIAQSAVLKGSVLPACFGRAKKLAGKAYVPQRLDCCAFAQKG